ncbi:immunoglobulin-like and fibronectin type III domain-containing protein 1 [Misgurnus anguillicaudatus]|uniref:immunoglobulin-like and fibronectin type III domain-containing protein 1 n=1 Tax=Misgurnus anguillicaudatus TaxID=75329 RepID=UPI003CCF6C45
MKKPAEGTGVAIRKRSKLPGVMITQYVEELPPGMTTPDFTRKPIPLTIQEGKQALFTAIVNGDPVPEVSWGCNKGDISDTEKYITRFDQRNGEYILELPHVSSEQADTYKCLAINPFGRAVCTAALNVIEVGFKKRKPAPKNDPEDFRKMLKKKVVMRKEKPCKEGEIDPRFWEVLLSAHRKDYERICHEYGVTDFRWMLRKLNQMKMEREAEQSKYVEKVDSMKQIEVITDGTAKFELDMKLKDPSNKILLYKDGKLLDYGDGSDDSKRHNMKQFGETYLFSIRDLVPEDAGLYQVDVEDANMFSTSLSLPDVHFESALKDTTVVQGQDAVFECSLSKPLPQITWSANDITVEPGEKYDITVSKNKHSHKLAVKNCKAEDKGVYSAIVGLKSSQGTLVVEEDNAHGKADEVDELAGRLVEEQARLQREKDELERKAQEERDEAARKAQAEKDEATRKAQAERDEPARRKAQEEKDEAARKAQADRDEAARRKSQDERDEAARKAQEERDEAARKAQAEQDGAARRKAQAEKDEAARRKAQEEGDEAARRKAQAEQDEAARRKAQAERDEAARRKAQAEQDEATRKAQKERDEAARKAQAERDEAARRKAQEERDEAARRKAQAEKDEAARRKAQAERDEATRRKAQEERDEAARRKAQAEQDEAARRKAQAERDEAARRKAQAERDEATRKAQKERDEAARKAQAEQDEASRRKAQEERDEAARRKAQEERDETARRKAQEEGDEAARRKAQAEQDEEARRKAQEERDDAAARKAQAEQDEEARRKAQEERDEAARRKAQAERDEAARRKAQAERDEATTKAQKERDEAARKAQGEQEEAARRKAQEERDEAARRKAQEERDEAARRKAQAEQDEAARRKAQEERDEAARRKAQEERDEAARRKSQAEKDEAARKAQAERDEAARRKGQEEKDEAARKAQAERDEAAKRKAQAERDEAARRKGQAEKDEAARKAQAERDEAARRKGQEEKDEAARKAQAERDEAARRKAQEEKDEAARKAQAERDEAARRAQAEREEAARKAQAKQDAANRMAAMAARNGEVNIGSTLGETGKDEKGIGDKKRKKRVGELVPDTLIDHRVHFLSGLSNTAAKVGERAELSCKLSSEDSTGMWYKDGKELEPKDTITVVKDGAQHKLIINNCHDKDSGKYKFEAEGCKSEATLTIEDPPKIDADALSKFSEPVNVKTGESASFKLPFSGKDPIRIQWFQDDEELQEGHGVKIEKSSTHSRLRLAKCQRKDTSEIKVKIKNEFATVEASSKLIVLDKPTPPQGPVETVESSLSAVEFKWKPPKDDGGCKVTNYNLERQQVGRNTWTKIGDIPEQPTYRDTDVERGRKYCYKIRAKNSEGLSDNLTSEVIAAGSLAFPGSPAPPKIASAFKDCINLAWLPPSNTGGGSIIGYNVEKRKKGSNIWSQVNPKDEPIREKKYAVKDIIEGAEYEFRVNAINTCGPGEPSWPSECAFARDPKKPPGQVKDLKITGSSYTNLSLSWTKPTEVKGVEDEAKGYFLEIRPTDQLDWSRCNTNAVIQTSFTIVGLKSMASYWVRVIATNEGGEGLPQGLDNYIIAMPPPVKPKFTDSKMKSFMVVKAGNTVRVSVSFEASPLPDITWLKDGFPVGKHVTITNFDKGSQLFIYTSELCDTGIYTVTIKNVVGQDTFSIEIKVTDDPKPPGPVELEQNVQGTVTITWAPSPDEKRDDRLHYMVMQRDSIKGTWCTIADRLFNNKFTVINILPGREYNFRVFAKNDLSLSEPSLSPVWGTTKKKEKFTCELPKPKTIDFQVAPKFIVPLKLHAAPPGYECYMSCAVIGNPTPHITWYHDNVSLNTNADYYITNVCGICSLLILRVGPKDMGEYKVVAESPLGQAECSTKLVVRE